MKFIYKYQSPNFNLRKQGTLLKYIIIHYTAMTSDLEAIKHLCDKKNKVSAHYLINKNGVIFNLVKVKFRAWHAGISCWKGEIDINSSSIGIEIENSGHHLKFENYTSNQIKSLIKLLRILKKKYLVKSYNILGHSDIAPYRKIDPGEKFPWHILIKSKICRFNDKSNIKFQLILEYLFKELKIFNSDHKVLYLLFAIGYDTSLAKKNKNKLKMLIKAYQSHFRPSLVNGVIDKKTYTLIIDHYKQSLTI